MYINAVKISIFKKLGKWGWFSTGWLGARYIYRELLFPFLFAIGVVTFILLANFLIKSVDRLLGKGLAISVILEFLYLNLAWIVAMSVPMAVLVAALMAYGRLAEDNEITAMRSSGISFTTILVPGVVFGLVVSLVMLYFHDGILPDFNHRARLLAGDIYRKRPDLNIEPGYFVDDIPEYSIYVKEKVGESLHKITIYNKDAQDIQTTIYADSGFIVVEGNTILFTLYSGQSHEIDLKGLSDYRRIDFERHRIAIPVENLMLERRESARRGDREMTIKMMRAEVQRYTTEYKRITEKINNLARKELGDSTLTPDLKKLENIVKAIQAKNLQNLAEGEANRKNQKLNTFLNRIRGETSLALNYKKQIAKYNVEIQKKYSIPFACIVFMLMGAPLGVVTRRGGMTVAAVLSILFFLLYYVFLIGGEELADAAIITPFWAMWTPNLILFIIGVYLIYYTSTEQRVINFSHLPYLWRRLNHKIKTRPQSKSNRGEQ
ncbi:MAG: LptF/LptG family permease [Candidatus Marinimicrobia bacterium]|jgi:lipopolysaccharide export system permease protein|nr:LptF/LptG family permease [Candidatus Neomarinimicrobiota bacterium]MCK9483508.1 LptF/LptG family permease [Candidatus Neomarinimicrobiota bacterium]MCK9559403.1 LptF/LptG family permease [Candidatus Neomarinimicrobiota bacterium]